MINFNDAIQDFLAAMQAEGIEITGDLVTDGKLHRYHAAGDRIGSKNAWAILHLDGSPAGQFGCNKRFGSHKFSWKTNKSISKALTPEERKAMRDHADKKRREKAEQTRQRQQLAAERAKAAWDAAVPAPADHPYLARKAIGAHGVRLGVWEVVNPDTGEVRIISDKALLVPFMDRQRNVRNLQAILPGKLMSAGTRDKDFLKDGEKLGLFFPIGKPQRVDDCMVFVICEGFATGASIHEATGHCVLVTFDTSNLLAVADSIRERQADAIIIMAADNDQWTTTPIKNPGVHYARKAAEAVGGLVALPPFPADAEGQPTDFNDLHVRQGIKAVAAVFQATLFPPEPPAEPLPWDDEPPAHLNEAPLPDEAPADFEPDQAPEPAPAPAPAAQVKLDAVGDHDDDELLRNGYFTILGYDEDDYFFFQHEKRQVLRRKGGSFTEEALQGLAPVMWWEMQFPSGGDKGGINRRAAVDWIFRTANSRGIYDPSNIRGRGAWTDKGRAVYHHGSFLTVGGERMKLEQIDSGYVYAMARSLPEPSSTPLTDAEGAHLVSVAELVRWNMPGSAALMAGWAMLAPICGALTWRSHIWLTGPAGSGKSTVQKMFCAGLTRGIGIYVQGNSTEAGVRQKLKADALPVLLDEAESNNEREKQRMENLISLIRQTSTESQAETLKGTVSGDSQHYQIRSMFCLASINVNLPTKADVDRLTKLSIMAPKGEAADHWPKLEAELNKIEEDETISSRLLARSLNLMPVILATVKVFRKAAAQHFASQRLGDQFGTLLAGCWCLQKSHVPSEAEALVLIKGYDWKEHTEDQDQDDASRALEALLGAKVRMGGGMPDKTVFELVRECSPKHCEGVVEAKVAIAQLATHGMRVDLKAGILLFGTSVTNLKDLIKNMPAVTDLRDQLLRIPGGARVDKTTSFNGSKSKCVSIPLGPILGDGKEEEEDDKPF